MKRHVALLDTPVFTGFIVVDVMPPIRMVEVVHRGRAKQELNLVARHADLKFFDQSGIDAITLGDIHSIHAARECYNKERCNKD